MDTDVTLTQSQNHHHHPPSPPPFPPSLPPPLPLPLPPPSLLPYHTHIEIPQLLDAVADVPVVRVVQVLTGAVVEETVELPRLHSLRNLSSGAAQHRVDELTG